MSKRKIPNPAVLEKGISGNMNLKPICHLCAFIDREIPNIGYLRLPCILLVVNPYVIRN